MDCSASLARNSFVATSSRIRGEDRVSQLFVITDGKVIERYSKLQRGRKFLDATGDLDRWKRITRIVVSRPDDPSSSRIAFLLRFD